MYRVSQVLAQGVYPGMPKSYRALADHGNVPRSTLRHRARGRHSREEKAQGQQYLNPYEENVVVKYLSLFRNIPSSMSRNSSNGSSNRDPRSTSTKIRLLQTSVSFLQ